MTGSIIRGNKDLHKEPFILPENMIKLPSNLNSKTNNENNLHEIWSKPFFARKFEKLTGLSVDPATIGRFDRGSLDGIHHYFLARPNYDGKPIKSLLGYESHVTRLLSKFERLWSEGLPKDQDQILDKYGTHVMRQEIAQYHRPLRLLVKPPKAMLQNNVDKGWIKPMNSGLTKQIKRVIKNRLVTADAQSWLESKRTSIKSGYYLSSQGLVQVFDVSIPLINPAVLEGRLSALASNCESAIRELVVDPFIKSKALNMSQSNDILTNAQTVDDHSLEKMLVDETSEMPTAEFKMDIEPCAEPVKPQQEKPSEYVDPGCVLLAPIIVVIRPSRSWVKSLVSGGKQREKQRIREAKRVARRIRLSEQLDAIKSKFTDLLNRQSKDSPQQNQKRESKCGRFIRAIWSVNEDKASSRKAADFHPLTSQTLRFSKQKTFWNKRKVSPTETPTG